MSFLETLAGQVLSRFGVHSPLGAAILIFGLIFCRIVTSVMLAPFLGGPSVPGQIKVGLGAVLAVVLFPSVTQSAGAVHVPAQAYLALLAKEAAVGAVIGFFAQAVFYGIQMAGILIDTQRGMNQVTYLAPQLPGHTSALGNLKLQVSIVLFLALDGHLGYLRALANSFAAVPILEMPHLRAGIPALADATARITATAISIGFQLSAPVLLAIFLVDRSNPLRIKGLNQQRAELIDQAGAEQRKHGRRSNKEEGLSQVITFRDLAFFARLSDSLRRGLFGFAIGHTKWGSRR